LVFLSASILACGKDSPDDTGSAVDADGDGYAVGEDCDDSDAAINPGADELCDDAEVDEDCDGLINDADDNFADGEQGAWHPDEDGDGYGDLSVEALLACVDPSTETDTYVEDGSDCNDSDVAINPDAQEVCDPDNVDEDCNGEVDDEQAGTDASTKTTWYADSDSDGFGDEADKLLLCDQPSGYVTDSTDCDDAESTTYPGADEYCDGVNNDCDADTDEDDAVDVSTWYADSDSDGYGDASVSDIDCYQPTGYVADNTDCDDSDTDVNPAATEVCDGIDNDCDSTTTEDDMAQFVSTSGAVTDYTSIGSSTSPSTSPPSADGTLTLCDGTFYANWDLEYDLELVSLNGDPTSSVLSGGDAGVIFRLGDYDSNYGSGYGVDLSVDGVGLTEGLATTASYDLAGAISCVASSASSPSIVTLSNTVFDANVSNQFSASAIFSYNCDLTVSDSEFTGNDASRGTIYLQQGGIVSITDTVFDGNTGLYYSVIYGSAGDSLVMSGVDIYDNETTGNTGSYSIYFDGSGGDVSFDDVAVYSNTAGVGGSSGMFLGGLNLSWVGSSSSSSGVWANEDSGAGIYIGTSATNLEVDTVDFGASGSNDNADYDIDFSSYLGSAYYAPDDASFVCNNYRCGDDADGDGDASNDEEECAVGDLSTATHYDFFEDVVWGSVFLADTSATLESFDAYMSADSNCSMDWYVFSSSSTLTSSTTMTWTVEWAMHNQSTSGTSGAWMNSGHIGLPVESGMYYSLAYVSDCSSYAYNVGPYYSSNSGIVDGGFGENVGFIYNTTNWADKSEGDSFSRYTYYSSTEFLTRAHVTDLDAPSAGVCP